ncbi:MAG: hypothetical protein IJA78_02745 [Clostridia bacterium]|nr:hypothetical protein [Clostridia bacterium]
MSGFNRFCNAARRTATKITDRAGELVDNATAAVKIKGLEMRIDEQYENLGRVIYRDLHTEESLEEEKLRIIAAIDALFDRIAELKGEVADSEDATEECEAPACESDTAAEEAPTEE